MMNERSEKMGCELQEILCYHAHPWKTSTGETENDDDNNNNYYFYYYCTFF